MSSERRRAERHPVDTPGHLFLSEGRKVPVRLKNVGALGALVVINDLEEPVFEGERAVLEHPRWVEGTLLDEVVHSIAAIVRVELDFEGDGVARQLAVYFDGGSMPEGYVAAEMGWRLSGG